MAGSAAEKSPSNCGALPIFLAFIFYLRPFKGFLRLGLLYTSARICEWSGNFFDFPPEGYSMRHLLSITPSITNFSETNCSHAPGCTDTRLLCLQVYTANNHTEPFADSLALPFHLANINTFIIIGHLTEPLRSTHKRRRSSIPSGIVLRPPMINSRCKDFLTATSRIRLPFPDRSLL